MRSITKPARYFGGEFNSVVKAWDSVACRFLIGLPDLYEVGMSNLGLSILYNILNSREDTLCERIFAPAEDMAEKIFNGKVEFTSLENKMPVKKFDIVGLALQSELNYSNIPYMLELAKIPAFSKDRKQDDPFITGGGLCTYNSEPIADFFDFLIIGEGEEIMGEIIDAYIRWKKSNKPREDFLKIITKIRGIYVPNPSDSRNNFSRVHLQINKRVVHDLNTAQINSKPIVPFIDVIHNRAVLEIFRGCSRGCRFCQAGMAYRPVRERSPENLAALAKNIIDSTGYDELTLSSLSSADYSNLVPLIDALNKSFCARQVKISLPSLRIDSFTVNQAAALHTSRKSSLTFAPEAGTQRLRDVINKGVTEQNLFDACTAAFQNGWHSLKLYFMIGLPTETDTDVIAIATLAQKVVDLHRKISPSHNVKVTVSVSCFVPKPHTPFQWTPQISVEKFQRRQLLLKNSISNRAIKLNYHDAHLSALEGTLARGDRRLSNVILAAYKNGAKFDAWSDKFNRDAWQKAFRDCNINPAEYANRQRSFTDILPWDHTSPAISKSFLIEEAEKALRAETTPDCRRSSCTGCGVCPNLGVHVIDYSKIPAHNPARRQEVLNARGKSLFPERLSPPPKHI